MPDKYAYFLINLTIKFKTNVRNYFQDMLVNVIRKIKISSRIFVICMNN